MPKPFKGIFKDCNLIDQPEGTYRDARNILYNKLKDSVCNESGNVSKDSLGNYVLGSVNDGDKEIIFTASGTGTSIIYEFDGEDKSIVVQDFSNLLKFDVNYPIKSILFRNNKGERVVVFTDDLNSPKIINLDSGDFSTINSYSIDLIQLFPKSDVPKFDSIVVNSGGGSLLTGSYQFALSYILDDNSETNYFGVSNFTRITRSSESLQYNKYIGNDSGVSTSKSISITINNIDTSYKYVRLAVIKYIDGVYSAEKVSDYAIQSNELIIVYAGNEVTTDLLIDEIIVNNAYYDTAKAIVYSNRSLYLANLSQGNFYDYRGEANNIVSKWVYDTPVALDSAKNSYKDPNISYLNGSFMPNEVYAFYIAFKIKQGGYSPAFHIPGRLPVILGSTTDYENSLCSVVSDNSGYEFLSDDVAIDNNIKWFHTRDTGISDGTMGFWENESEYYANDYPTFPTEKVRHHKFPPVSELSLWSDGDFINGGGDISASTFIGDYIRDTQSQSVISFVTSEDISIDYGDSAYLESTIDNIEWRILALHFTKSCYIDIDISVDIGPSSPNDTVFYNIELQYQGLSKDVIFEETGQQANVDVHKTKYSVDQFDTLYFRLGYSTISSPAPNVSTNATLIIKAYTSLSGSLFTNALGVRFENIQIPSGISDIVDGYEIFYAKRGLGNATIAAQSVLFKEGDTSSEDISDWNNRISDIGAGENFATHPIDLLVNESYPAINSSFISNELLISDFDTDNKRTFNSLQEYSGPVDRGNQIRSIENVEYVPYSNQYKVETYLKGRLPKELAFADNTYLSNLCQYLPNIYRSFNSQQLISTGSTHYTATTSSIYGGDMYINEVGIRTLPEYINESGSTFADRVRKGTYSYVCFNRINAGLLQNDPTNTILFYPFDNIATYPVISDSAYSIWAGLSSDIETPDNYDNYAIVNTDLFYQNIANPVGHFNPDDDIELFPNLIIKSNINQSDESTSGVRTFLATNYYEMPNNKGEIVNLDSKGKILIIHTENSIYKTISEVTLPTSAAEVTLGSGSIFRIEPEEIMHTTQGYAGTQHPHSCLMTKGGYFFIDLKRNKIFLMSDKLEEISNFGMKRWFEENLPFNLNTQLRNYGAGLTELTPNFSKYGIGFNVIFDDKYNRIILVKRDFDIVTTGPDVTVVDNKVNIANSYMYAEEKAFCTNKSWSISYSLETKTWTSFQDYYPYYQLAINNNHYSYFDDNLYQNNVEYSTNENDKYIDFVFNNDASFNKLVASINWDSEYYGSDGLIDTSKTFNEITVLNSNQHSGLIGLNPASDSASRNLAKVRGVWNFNGFRDITTGNTSDTPTSYESTRYYTNSGMEWYDKKRFIDKYNVVRLSSTIPNNLIYLTNIDISQRVSTF